MLFFCECDLGLCVSPPSQTLKPNRINQMITQNNTVAIRRLAVVWWMRNLNRGNFARASRWERLADKYGKEVEA